MNTDLGTLRSGIVLDDLDLTSCRFPRSHGSIDDVRISGMCMHAREIYSVMLRIRTLCAFHFAIFLYGSGVGWNETFVKKDFELLHRLR